MDLTKIPLFRAAAERLAWLDQRQQVLARNIANADTPGFRPNDLKAFRFSDMVRAGNGPLPLAVTRPAHLGGSSETRPAGEEEKTRRPFETAPAGNAVVLEQQMAKVNETSLAHQLISRVYAKNLGMIRTALGRAQ